MTEHADPFANLTMDEDTQLKNYTAFKLNGMPARHEKWVWDGIIGETVVLLSEQAQQYDDETLKAMVREAFELDDQAPMTLARQDTYTFINFNFFEMF